MREVKDSGIEWVGSIPTHWRIHPVYYYFGEGKNKNRLGQENNLLSLSYGKIVRKDINSSDGLLPESFNTYNIVEADDIIIRPTDLQNDKRSLRTGLVHERGIITSAYICLRPIKKIDSRFFNYQLHAYSKNCLHTAVMVDFHLLKIVLPHHFLQQLSILMLWTRLCTNISQRMLRHFLLSALFVMLTICTSLFPQTSL